MATIANILFMIIDLLNDYGIYDTSCFSPGDDRFMFTDFTNLA